MNALGINEIGSNVRILLLNNCGGEEFYYNQGCKVPSNEHLLPEDKALLEKALPIFMDERSERPILTEAFTEMKYDSDVIYDFYDLSSPRDIKL